MNLKGDSPYGGPVDDHFRFPEGAFSMVGHYVVPEEIAPTLDVSIVPLPAAAPMFGGAVLGLAGLGFAARRKKTAA